MLDKYLHQADLAIASVVGANALAAPVLAICADIIYEANTTLPVLSPFIAESFNATSVSYPFILQTAKSKAKLIPNAQAAVIAPFVASYFKESNVPAFAIFLACSYVTFPFLTRFLASDVSDTP